MALSVGFGLDCIGKRWLGSTPRQGMCASKQEYLYEDTSGRFHSHEKETGENGNYFADNEKKE